MEIRERIELVHTSEFKGFLAATFEAFRSILQERTRPGVETVAAHGKLRLTTLNILNRLPNNDVLRPFAIELLRLAMDVLETDCEEPALVALRIIFDLHKNYRPSLSDHVQPFLGFVIKVYTGLEASVRAAFYAIAEPNALPSTHISSVQSFRVLTECPLIVMLLFQLYPAYISSNIPQLIPIMMRSLSLSPAPQTRLRFPKRYKELVACQVKSLSFLTYLLRGFSALMKPHQDMISQSVISLMQTCPPEALSTRKELLVATRHILATDFREGFFKHADLLFKEPMLIGTGRLAKDSLRPLGFSTLADLVHHIRSSLTLPQFHRVVHIYSRTINDGTLPTTIQSTSVRLLLNLVDHIFHNTDFDEVKGKVVLVKIINTLVHKFGTLRTYIAHVAQTEESRNKDLLKREASTSDGIFDSLYGSSAPLSGSSRVDEQDQRQQKQDQARVWKHKQQALSSPPVIDSIDDLKSLIKTMLLGLKTVIWCVNNYRVSKEQLEAYKHRDKRDKGRGALDPETYPFKFTDRERDLVSKYLKWGLECLSIFKVNLPSNDTAPESPDSSSAKPSVSSAIPSTPSELKQLEEYREVLNSFAASFTVLDPFNVKMTVGLHVTLLFDALLADPQVMAFPQNLLVHPQVSQAFAEVVLNFLMTRIDELASDDANASLLIRSKTHPNRSNVQLHNLNSHKNTHAIYANNSPMTLLRLFKIVFSSIGLFPDNEAVLRPHLQTLVVSCLRSATQTSSPGNFYYLLRALFRSISGGKFEHAYKELLPLLPTVLNGLHRVHAATEDTNMRDTIVELCLTIPARLSSLLPHLPLLMRLMVHALRSYGDLVNLGLRTLEFWVDNLNPEFLYPVMCQQKNVLAELMTSLCNHLRPAPYPFGMLALRLLGKLGGRNRRFLAEPIDLPLKDSGSCDYSPSVVLKCEWTASPDLIMQDKGHCSRADEAKGGKRGGGSGKRGEKATSVTSDERSDVFGLPLDESIATAVEVLKRVAKAQELRTPPPPPVAAPDGVVAEADFESSEGSVKPPPPLPRTVHEACETLMEECDLSAYCIEFMNATKLHQSRAALQVLKSTLSMMVNTSLDVGKSIPVNTTKSASDVISAYALDGNGDDADDDSDESETLFPEDDVPSKKAPFPTRTPEDLRKDRTLEMIAEGLLYGTKNKDEKVRNECKALFEGLGSHILILLSSQSHFVARVSGSGSICDSILAAEAREAGSSSKAGRVPQIATGSFRLLGPLHFGADPFVINHAIVSMLCDGVSETRQAATTMIESLVSTATSLYPLAASASADDAKGCFLLFEHLLTSLLQACYDKPWNLKAGAYDGISALCCALPRNYVVSFETQIMTTALFILKDSPREVSSAAVEGSLGFLIQMLSLLYGNLETGDDELWTDALALPGSLEGKDAPSVGAEASRASKAVKSASPQTVLMLIHELTSSKHIVRFGARLALQHIANSDKVTVALLLGLHESEVRRMIFGKSLLGLPLVQQVGIVESLVFAVSKAPGFIPIDDPQLILCLKDVLEAESKLELREGSAPLSGGAGSTSSSSSSAAHMRGAKSSATPTSGYASTSSTPHASAIFLRGPSFLKADVTGGPTISIQSELPHSIQLRVSSLLLIRSVINMHTLAFFKNKLIPGLADVRATGMCFVFQSLVSSHPQVVMASHAALQDAVKLDERCRGEGLGVIDADFSTSLGLRANQTFVTPSSTIDLFPEAEFRAYLQPILFKLTDVQSLSLHFTAGLSKLLALLAPRFSETLAETFFRRLDIWNNPSKAINEGFFRPGEEPIVAASILNLYHLLPRTDLYLQPLIDVTLKLDATLIAFTRYRESCSPYRKPLAMFLSKYPKRTVEFFLDPQRLSKPAYSALFVALLKIPEGKKLREYVSSEGGTSRLLTVCLGIPLAITKLNPQDEQGTPDEERRHGVNASITWRSRADIILVSEEQLKVDMNNVATQRKLAEQNYQRSLAYLQSVSASEAGGVHGNNINGAKNQENLNKRELYKAEQKVKLANETAEHYKNYVNASASVSLLLEGKEVPAESAVMTTDSLEWMYQGLCIYEVLMEADENFMAGENHTNVAVAMRTLWRSRGRRVRLDSEERMFQHFQLETKLLAKCLLRFSASHPEDVELLFELLDVFLHPTVIDFSFVKNFYQRSVSEIMKSEHKKSLLHMFFKKLRDGTATEDFNVHAMQLLVLPMLRVTLESEKGWAGFGGLQLPRSEAAVRKRSASAKENKGEEVSVEDKGTAAEEGAGTEGEEEEAEKAGADVEAGRQRPHAGSDSTTVVTISDAGSKNRSEVVDSEIIKMFMQDALDATASSGDKVGSAKVLRGERLSVELLKLSTLLIEFMGRELVEHRKELIKFAWNHLKSEDSTSKQWAYVNVCRFISVYETPSKIILQVYVALLRTFQPEAKDLVRTALDILVPALGRRLPPTDFIKAIKWTKKIMYEEGHALPQLVHMWRIITTHPSIFYKFRSQFVPHMVNSLNKLGLHPNCTIENRQLAISLVDLIISWELQCLAKAKNAAKGGEKADTGGTDSQQRSEAATSATMKGSGDKRTLSEAFNVEGDTKDKDKEGASPEKGKGKSRGSGDGKGDDEGDGEDNNVGDKDKEKDKDDGDGDGEGNKSKKIKGNDGGAIKVEAKQSAAAATDLLAHTSPVRARDKGTSSSSSTNFGGDDFRLNQPMIEIITNFLFRLALLVADSNDESGRRLAKRAIKLFRQSFVVFGKPANIRSVYFDKLFSLCHEQRSEEMKIRKHLSRVHGSGSENRSAAPSNSAKVDTRNPQISQERVVKVSAESISATLDVLNCLLRVPSNEFFLNNASHIKLLLYPAFQVASKAAGADIRRKLITFTTTVCATFGVDSPPEKFLNSGFFQSLKEQIDIVINDAILEKSGGGSGRRNMGSMGNVPSVDKIGDVDNFEIGRGGGRCSAYFALRIIEQIGKTSPSFIENFAFSIVRLAQKLTRDHIQAATISTRSMAALMSQMDGSGLQKVLATPTLAIFEEATANDEKEVIPPGSAIRSLIIAVRLLSQTSAFVKFGDLRKPSFQIISVLLDKSDSVPLLMTIVAIIGRWLLDDRTPLTQKERTSLVWKISSFDRLPEVPAQPLIAMSLRLLTQCYDNSCSKAAAAAAAASADVIIESEGTTDNDEDDEDDEDDGEKGQHANGKEIAKTKRGEGHVKKPATTRASLWPKSYLGKPQTQGLLSADPAIREIFFSLFAAQNVQSAKDTAEKQMEFAASIGSKTLLEGGVEGRAPLDVLTQILFTDWESCGSRYWLVACVDLLLASTHHSGGVEKASCGLSRLAGGAEQSAPVSATTASTKKGTKKGDRSKKKGGKKTSVGVGEKEGHDAPSFWLQNPGEPTTFSASKSTGKASKSASSKGGQKLDGKSVEHFYATFRELLDAERTCELAGRGRCIGAIRQLSHANVDLAQSLWVYLLQTAWSSLPSDECRKALIPPLESLLSRPYHRQFLYFSRKPVCSDDKSSYPGPSQRLNVVTGLLRGILTLDPMPSLDVNLIGSLGSNYNAWYDVIPFMENRIMAAKSENDKFKWSLAMKTLLDQLGETDMSFALKRNMCSWSATRKALSLEMYGQLTAAVKCYDDLINLPSDSTHDIAGGSAVASEQSACSSVVPMDVDLAPSAATSKGPGEAALGSSDQAKVKEEGKASSLGLAAAVKDSTMAPETQHSLAMSKVPPTEMSLWEERWVVINKQLGQWAVLKSYAEGTGCAELLMECSWKSRDWDSVRRMCSNPSIVAALEGGAPKNKLHEIYLSIADGKLNDVEKLCAQCVQLALHNWQLLPPLSAGGEAHVELLRLFHRLVELRESGQIMVEVSSHNRKKTYPDLKNVLATWRERLPNEWDSLDVFDDLFTWRGHMFAAVTSNFSWIDAKSLAALHDRPWTAIRLSSIARKQNVKEVGTHHQPL